MPAQVSRNLCTALDEINDFDFGFLFSTTTAGGFQGSMDQMAFDLDGNMVVVDTGGFVRKVTPAGSVTELFGSVSSTSVRYHLKILSNPF